MDSTRVREIDLPYTFGLGVRYRLSPRLELATQGLLRTWSGANSDLLADGAPGAKNTVDLSLGGEYVNPRRPYQLPLRFGVRYATNPFPLPEGRSRARSVFRSGREAASPSSAAGSTCRWSISGGRPGNSRSEPCRSPSE